jgi:predicted outer membrane protein
MMMKGMAAVAALGLLGLGVSADEVACAPKGQMKQVQVSAFSMEGMYR